ncbi:efflux transporter outer membrane subunit [Dyella choica]|uniref:Efflux transporter outer membrane subunit n=1 Tax=Dyella choica TaxID=1927959 RepID=A0A3S0PJK3_9GAMM|nr:efflux transporter outer membrane subunit [Dyella choica]RUL77482.1 efflux transporter outer membrane subunit [Dyella choica]
MKTKPAVRVRPLLVMLAATLISACDLAPQYSRPSTPPVSAYKEAGQWITATPSDAIPRENWWTVFHDATLDTLEARVTQANQDLQGAIARFDEARADARQAQADFYPTIDANGSATRNHLSGNVANPLPHRTFQQYNLGLDFSYELDIWGRVRNEARAGKYRTEASAGDLATLDLSVHAELAVDYFLLRGYDSEQDILDRTVQNYQTNLDLTEARIKVGYARKSDVSAARAQWESARTQAAEIKLKRAKLEHAIAILTGVPPANLSLPGHLLDVEPPSIDAALPSQLLERRPDVASAERRVAAANADIGVARAAYFPTINLNTLIGLAAGGAGSVFSASSQAWSFGPSATLNVFDGGRRGAINAKARAQHDEAVATYRQTVLKAFGEVEDNLVSLNQLAQEAQTQQAAVTDSAETTRHATDLYKGGLQSYFDVVQAQNIELQARLADVDVRTRRMTSSVLLIKALGGGWSRDALELGATTAESTVRAK